MAHMIPDRILDEKAPQSEHKAFKAFTGLDDAWSVFHSVAWQGKRGRRQSDGEADFVLAHPKKGLIIVEVKGGGISMVDGQWVSTDRFGASHGINPFAQIRDSKHFLGEYLAETVPRVGNKVHMGHAVVFPDVDVDGDLSAEGQREVILDRNDLRDIGSTVRRLAAHWNDSTTFDAEQFAAVRRALAPSRTIRRLLRHDVEDQVEQLFDLTDQQFNVLALLRHQRRALITGGAGTGKTVLAFERARQLAEAGHDVLLLCFNAPLGDLLRTQASGLDRMTAGSFHSIARTMANEAGMLPDGEWDQAFWDERLPATLPDAAEKLGRAFDAIIVDEGQDFHADWWTALELLLRNPDDGFFYVFADAQQNLYRQGWEPPFLGGGPFELTINCRNTVPIAERVGAVFGNAEESLGVPGLNPSFVEVTSPSQVPKKLGEVVRKLMTEGGMRPGQITVLSTEKKLVDGLRGQKLGEHELVAPDSKKAGVVVETVQRFKGLENDVVVVVLPEINGDDDRALAYVGMSRARAVLVVLCSTAAKAALNWA